MAKRARTRSGRFTKRRTRTTRGRSYSVKRRRNPRPSTKGGRRVSARRAYMRTAAPRRRRRNPTGILSSPAVRYSLAASAGFFGAAFADSAPWLNPTKADGSPMLPFGIRGSLLGAIALALLGRYGASGKNRQYLYAGAVGMAAPTAIGLLNTALPGGALGNAQYNLPGPRRPLSLPRANPHRQSAARFVRASNAIDNQVA